MYFNSLLILGQPGSILTQQNFSDTYFFDMISGKEEGRFS